MAEVPISSETRPPSKLTTLIVEDDPAMKIFLRDYLKDKVDLIQRPTDHPENPELYERADDVQAMLEQRGVNEPVIDLVITDLGLKDGPEKGYEVVAAVKAKHPNVHTVLFTGSADILEKDQEGLKAKGIDELWGKPLPLAFLRQRVQEITQAKNNPPSLSQGPV